MLLAALAVAACRAGDSSPVPKAGSLGFRAAVTPISHVVFIVQENRSFNNLFLNFPGAKTQNYGYDTKGQKIALQPVDLATDWDIDHFSQGFFAACDGQGQLPGTKCKMDGWNLEKGGFGAPSNFAYMYVREKQIDPYWKMAEQYVLADRMFPSNLDGSFISHQYAISAFASHAVDGPVTSWGCEGGKRDTIPTLTKKRAYGGPIVACFDIPSIASEADAAGISWRFYAGALHGDGGIWSAYQANRKIFNGPDWMAATGRTPATDVISPPAQFLTDVGKGQLANVTWITPTYAASDHPGLDASQGPAWIASLVNAIGTSKFWKSTAIFIMWDDWGGWFDPVKPVYEDYDGLGFRVPLIVISPYARKGYVTHVQYETSSVLRYIEDNFGLAPMAASDERANDPAGDAFDYAQQPRKFKKFAGSKTKEYWLQSQRNSRTRGIPKSLIGDD
jgi:phospholipase C